MTDSLIDLLKSNVVEGHGVTNVWAVVNELEKQNKNPATEFTRLFYAPEGKPWCFYAVVGMRSLVERGSLKKEEARTLLKMTETLVLARRSMEEYYRTISILASSRETAPVLVEFVEEKLGEKDQTQWRWLAFFAVGELLQAQKATIPRAVVEKLLEEVNKEPEPQRRWYLNEVATTAQRRALSLP